MIWVITLDKAFKRTLYLLSIDKRASFTYHFLVGFLQKHIMPQDFICFFFFFFLKQFYKFLFWTLQYIYIYIIDYHLCSEIINRKMKVTVLSNMNGRAFSLWVSIFWNIFWIYRLQNKLKEGKIIILIKVIS